MKAPLLGDQGLSIRGKALGSGLGIFRWVVTVIGAL